MIDEKDLIEDIKEWSSKREIEWTSKSVISLLESAPQINGWIPASERLPVEDGRYLIMLKNLTGYDVLLENIIIARYTYSDWDYIGWRDNTVIAWQSLPEPWKESVEE